MRSHRPSQRQSCIFSRDSFSYLHLHSDDSREVIISLNSDSAFYQVLITALRSLAEHQTKVQEEFAQTVQQLSLDISNVSQPSSSQTGKSDLYAWRKIFQMWVDGQIFESTTEKNRGERSVEDSEAKLTEFANKVVKEGLGDHRTLQRKESRDALERFLQINVLLLDLKKVSHANPLSGGSQSDEAVVPRRSSSLPTRKLRAKS